MIDSKRILHCLSSLLLTTSLTACPDDSAVDGSGTDSGNDSTSTGDVSVDTVSTTGVTPDPMTASGTDTADTTADTADTTADTADTTADTTDDTSGDCMRDCDDGIECTDDECVDGECVNTPVDTNCDDEIDCTADSCDAARGCLNEPDDVVCDDGVDCTADTCDAEMGCVYPPDDALCDDGVMCTTGTCDAVMDCQYTPDDALCDDGVMCTTGTCDAVMDCQYTPDDALCDDGSGCTVDSCDLVMGCINDATVLVLNATPLTSTAPEDAVTALGYTPIVTTDEASFIAAYDAGGFSAIVFDSANFFNPFPVEVQTRLDAWVAGGERLIYGYWDLDASPEMQATLDVTVNASFNDPLPIFPDPMSPIDLFAAPEMIMAPLTYTQSFVDSGDQISPTGMGFTAGRFTDAMMGPGAIVVTHSDRVLTNGFMISEIAAVMTDGDGDGINDGEELLRNEIDYVCGVP